jgi:hypothetical protein
MTSLKTAAEASDSTPAGAAGNSELCRRVLQYSGLFKPLVEKAKQPGFSVADWAPIAELVAVADFVRVGCFKEMMNWHQYVEFLTHWARSAQWESSFRRIHEWSGVVFLELEERSLVGGVRDVVNSLSVYEFNSAGKIHHLDVYLQRQL